MKITAVETHVCHARMRNWVFVRVLTDEDGLWGWGEATLEWHTRAVVGAVGDLDAAAARPGPHAHRAPLAAHAPRPLLARHGHRAGDRHLRHRHRALGPAGQGARRALPPALGRAGARPRAALRPPRRGRDGRLLRARRRHATSPSAPRPWSRPASPPSRPWPCPPRCRSRAWPPLRYAERCVGAMREAAGEDIDIMVDCHARPSPRMGHRFAAGARAVRPVLAGGALLGRAAARPRRRSSAACPRPSPPASG